MKVNANFKVISDLRLILPIIFLITNQISTHAKDNRLDSFNVIRYDIHLDVSRYLSKNIYGYTTLTYQINHPNTKKIELDLYQLTIDSILDEKGNALKFSYNGDKILFDNTLTNLTDTRRVDVYYHGQPKVDASGFGGLAIAFGYIYNLGIAFNYQPHNFGRGWFPCVDNFVDKAEFSFDITSISKHSAYCNGLRLYDTLDINGLRHTKWETKAVIPPYLASIAVGEYYEYAMKVKSIHAPSKSIDCIVACFPKDSISVKNNFKNLEKIFNFFEEKFGPYHFERLGYVSVPQSGGAMEHSTNIAFPAYAFSGAMQDELVGHELAHHWWGNLITCSTAEDMWLNEGWASFCESLVSEALNGIGGYNANGKSNHYQVIRFAHLYDSTYRTIANMTLNFTYGRHIYWKGASLVRSLRAYMGDEKFFSASKAFLDSFMFDAVDSKQFIDFYSVHSSLDLKNFFDVFLYEKGFNHFEITNWQKKDISTITMEIAQRKKISQKDLTKINLIATAYDKQFRKAEITIPYEISKTEYEFNLPKSIDVENIILVTLNEESSITDAKTSHRNVIKKGLQEFSSSPIDAKIIVNNQNSLTDSALLYIEQNHLDATLNYSIDKNFVLNKDRYWTVSGNYSSIGADLSMEINYDGRALKFYTLGGFRDNSLFNFNNEFIDMYRDATEAKYSFMYCEI
jgi:aminopeptidase N